MNLRIAKWLSGRCAAVLVCGLCASVSRAGSLVDYTTGGLNVTYSGTTLSIGSTAGSVTGLTIGGISQPSSNTTSFAFTATTPSSSGVQVASAASLSFVLADGTKIDDAVFSMGFFDFTHTMASQFKFSSFQLNDVQVNAPLDFVVTLNGAFNAAGTGAISNTTFTAVPLPGVSLAGLSLIGGAGLFRFGRRNRRAA